MPSAETVYAHLKVTLLALLVGLFPVTESVGTQSRNLEIISYGDSITAGLSRTQSGGAINCASGVSLEQAQFSESGTGCYGNGVANVGGYQVSLKTMLDLDGYLTSVYNWGFSGIQTSAMVSELSAVLDAQPDSDYVLILGGANDAFEVISKSTVRHNIEVMADMVLARGMIPVIATPTPITVSGTLNKRIDDYVDEIKSLASQRNFLLADHNGIMDAGWHAVPYHSGDFLHLGTPGNLQMASNWYQTLGLDPFMAPVLAPVYLLLLDDE